MGWFSSDEIVQVENSAHDTLQTVALGLIAIVALIFGILRILNAHLRNKTERAASAAVRLQTVSAQV